MTATVRPPQAFGRFPSGLLARLAVALGITYAAASQAGQALTVSDGVTSAIVTNAPWSYVNSSFDAAWTVVITSGRSKPVLGSATNPTLDLSVQCTSEPFSSVKNLTITYSDNGFGPTAGSFQALVTGHMLVGTGQSLTYNTYLDPGNVTGTTNSLLTSSGSLPLAANVYSNTATSTGISRTLYSLTQVITIPGSTLAGGSYSLDLALGFTPAPRPVLGFGSAHPLTSSGLALSLQTLPGLAYQVDASTNLLNWNGITNFTSTNTLMLFLDPAATNFARRFYRAVVQ